jgi:glycosyltransferase involved in cell wall biosynthesis
LKILIYVHALAGGGTERICTVLANGFLRAGHDVTVAVDYDAQENLALLDPSVKLFTLGKNHALSILRLAQFLWREQPDISFSGIGSTNLKHALAALLSGRLKRAILSVHGYYESEPQLLNRIAYYLTPILTRWSATTVCVSQGLLDYMKTKWKADPRKTRLIYNPVYSKSLGRPISEADLLNRDPVIIASGRLVDYKNFARLIRAFSKIDVANARLQIMGQGPEESKLKELIAELGMGDRVELLGYVKEPWSLMSRARVLALSSDSEAFGLVIVEGMANGLAIVATQCDGPKEILQNGQYGALIPHEDEPAFTRALTQALMNPGDPSPRIARANEFSEEIGLAAYVRLFEDVLTGLKSATKEAIAKDPERPPPLLFYTHALADGGAERVWTLLASGFHRRGYKVIMVVDYELNENKVFLDPGIELIILKGNHLENISRLYRLIKDREPSCILSALSISNLKCVIAAGAAGQLKKTIISYHGFFETENQLFSRISYFLTPVLSRICGHVVAVSDVLLMDLEKRFWADQTKTTRIYNPVVWGENNEALCEGDLLNREPIILASGRLAAAKHFDKLIMAFTKVKTPEARLVILGEGPERKKLEGLIGKLGLTARISLPGYIAQPWTVYRKVRCFALTSELESFGLVVVEALAHGLPVVATECQGPREILAQGEFGTLIEEWSEDEFAHELDRALRHPGDPQPRMQRASEFSLEPSLNAYEVLIQEVNNKGQLSSKTQQTDQFIMSKTSDCDVYQKGETFVLRLKNFE